SCSQKRQKTSVVSHLSFRWNDKLDSLLNDTLKSDKEQNAVKRSILEAKSDTQAINLLNRLAVLSGHETYLCTAEALKHAKSIGYTEGMVSAMGIRGSQFDIDSKYDSAGLWIDKALQTAKDLKNAKLVAHMVYKKASLYYDQSMYAKALELYNKAFEQADSVNDKRLVANSLYRIGETDQMMYDYFNALGYYNRAIQAAYEVADTAKVIKCLS